MDGDKLRKEDGASGLNSDNVKKSQQKHICSTADQGRPDSILFTIRPQIDPVNVNGVIEEASSSSNMRPSNSNEHQNGFNVNNLEQSPVSNASNNEFTQSPTGSNAESNFNIDKNSISSHDEVEFDNMETQCQKYKSCHEKNSTNNYDFNVPSTSGQRGPQISGNIACDVGPKGSRKRASNLDDDSSSDTGNDDYSLGSEDGCIYTYTGGAHLADLPSSFLSLDMGLPVHNHLPEHPLYMPAPENNRAGHNSRASSPDMDFLEMDFDPGPSCEADSGQSTSADELEVSPLRSPEVEDNVIVIRGTTPEANLPPPKDMPSTSRDNMLGDRLAQSNLESNRYNLSVANSNLERPSTSREITTVSETVPTTVTTTTTSTVSDISKCTQTCGRFISHINARGERLLVRRTFSRLPQGSATSLHLSSGDLVSPREILDCEMTESDIMWTSTRSCKDAQNDKVNLSSALYHCTMAKKLMVEKPNAEFIEGSDTSNLACDRDEVSEEGEAGVTEVGRCMIWSEREACERQVTQIGTSACGATALINAFVALGVNCDRERIANAVSTRLRANNAPVPRYLMSRAVAGCTASDIVTGLQKASDGLVTARFFPTYPERIMSLSHWLADWISLGAVPIATLNLQAGAEDEVPDAWHHQMIFGVSSRGVYLCNPLVCVHESALWPQLVSASTLLVTTKDVVSRFTPSTDLRPLMHVPDPRWQTYNVLGQVVNVIREWNACGMSSSALRTKHIRIPASYQAGITVAALTGSEAHKRLSRATHLPVVDLHP